jgi:hypothetical protein
MRSRFLTPLPLLGAGLSLLAPAAGRAQATSAEAKPLPSPYSLLPRMPGNYLAPLAVLRPWRDRYAASAQWRDPYFEELAVDESFVGNDADAVRAFDLARASSEAPHDTGPDPAVAALHGYRPVDARRAILSLAQTHRVLFINEAHHVPQGRAFILSLLKGLYRQGFRYYAAETFSDRDLDVQKRGYPIQKTGYYTREPVFGEVVRTALKLGFKLVPYEYQGSRSPFKASDPLAEVELRERGEAQNLYDRTLRRDTRARVLVHAGYGHIFRRVGTLSWSAGDGGAETSGSGVFIPMAVYFQRLSGVVPFSVDQSNLYAHSGPAHEDTLYRFVTERGLVKGAPVAFRNAHGQYYVPPSVRGGYDMTVCLPRPRYADGRPTWLRMDGLRRPTAIPPTFAAPRTGSILVQAFYDNEDPSRAVPVDQVEIPLGTKPPALMLPTGRFLLRLVDVSGRTLNQQVVTVKETP